MLSARSKRAAAIFAAMLLAEPVTATEDGKIDVMALPATGEPRRCLPLRSIGSTRPVGDNVIMVRTGPDSWYRNEVRQPCNALRHDRTIVHKTSSGMMCEMDIVQLVDPVSRMGFGACSLGTFTPVDVPRGARFQD